MCAAAVTFPSDLNAGTAAQRQTVQDLKHTVMIQSALPGAVTFLTCIFGVVSFTIAMFGDHRFGYTVLNCQRACSCLLCLGYRLVVSARSMA